VPRAAPYSFIRRYQASQHPPALRTCAPRTPRRNTKDTEEVERYKQRYKTSGSQWPHTLDAELIVTPAGTSKGLTEFRGRVSASFITSSMVQAK